MTRSPGTVIEERFEKTCSPYFFVKSEDANLDRMPLKSTTVAVDIAGVIADVRVTQVYQNQGQRPLEAIYVFPGSTRAAVYSMKMTIGERTIVARIEKKEDARQQYERAKQEGKSASLLEQHRPNVFQMNVANIMPGDEIRVELGYTELLVPTDCLYEFVYPTVVGPRYPGSEAEGISADAWVENPYLHQDEVPTSTFDIQVGLSAGLPVQKVTCTSHHADIQYTSQSQAAITLKPSETEGGNRDYILKYRLAGGQIESGLLLYEGEEENFFLLMAQPPEKVQDTQLPPREYIFIMDVSGSMGGFPMEVSKTLLKDLIRHLGPNDRFNLLQFSFGSKALSDSGSVPVNETNIQHALQLIEVARGSGGTEILPALKRALNLPRTAGMSCSVVIITDGFISVEPEVFDYIRQHLGEANMFAFGIGSSVNRHLIEGIAHVGGGEPFIVTKETEAAAQAATFRRYIQSPALTNLTLNTETFDTYDIEPPALPDLFAERPVLCFGKWRGARQGKMCLTGRIGEREYRYEADVSTIAPRSAHAALRYLWARHRIMLLGDYNKIQHDKKRVREITELGLKYSLLTDYTSFVAIDSEIRNKEGQTATVNQPLPLPQGVSDQAIRGRAFAPMSMGGTVLSEDFRGAFLAGGGDTCAEASMELLADEIVSSAKCVKPRREGRKSFLGSIFGSRGTPQTQTIADKIFRLDGEVWVDEAHTKTAKIIRIRRGSDAYIALIAAIPELTPFFAAKERIIVNIGEYSIEIAPNGKAQISREEIDRVKASWKALGLIV